MEGCARRKSYFFDDLGIQFESSARARDRAILNIERKKKKKMKRNSNNGKKNIFVLTFVLCDYETALSALSALFLSWFARFSRRGESNCSESRRP